MQDAGDWRSRRQQAAGSDEGDGARHDSPLEAGNQRGRPSSGSVED